jgi:hypothetical protein
MTSMPHLPMDILLEIFERCDNITCKLSRETCKYMRKNIKNRPICNQLIVNTFKPADIYRDYWTPGDNKRFIEYISPLTYALYTRRPSLIKYLYNRKCKITKHILQYSAMYSDVKCTKYLCKLYEITLPIDNIYWSVRNFDHESALNITNYILSYMLYENESRWKYIISDAHAYVISMFRTDIAEILYKVMKMYNINICDKLFLSAVESESVYIINWTLKHVYVSIEHIKLHMELILFTICKNNLMNILYWLDNNGLLEYGIKSCNNIITNAILYKNNKIVFYCIKSKFDINIDDAMIACVKVNNIEIITYLQTYHNAKYNIQNLYDAIDFGYVEIFEDILYGCDSEPYILENMYGVYYRISVNNTHNVVMMDMLYDKYNYRNPLNKTLWGAISYRAYTNSRYDILEWMISKKLNINTYVKKCINLMPW